MGRRRLLFGWVVVAVTLSPWRALAGLQESTSRLSQAPEPVDVWSSDDPDELESEPSDRSIASTDRFDPGVLEDVRQEAEG